MTEPQEAGAGPPDPAPSPRSAMVRSAAQFSVATVLSLASGIVRSFFVMKLLGVAASGVWMGLQLVVNYGANAHFGAVNGMHRNLPLLRGRGETGRLEIVKRTIFTFTLGMGVLLFALVAASAFGLLDPLARLFGERGRDVISHLAEPTLRPVLLGVAAVLPLNLMRSYYVTLFRAENRFREASQASIAGAVLGVVTLVLIGPFGLEGVVWGLMALIGVEALWLAVCAGVPRFGWSGTVLREQLSVGYVMVGSALLFIAFSTVDRTVLINHFTADVRGHYTPANLASTLFLGMAQVPGAVLYPRLGERFGRTGRPRELVTLVETPLRMVSIGFAMAAALGAVVAPAFLRIALPQFAPGTHALQIAVWGIALNAAVGVVANLLLVLNRQWLYVGLLALGWAASYGITELLVALKPGLGAVALGTSLGYLTFAVMLLSACWLLMEQPVARVASTVARTLLPMGWGLLCTAAFVFGLGRVLPLDSVLAALAGVVLVSLLFAPMALPELRKLLHASR